MKGKTYKRCGCKDPRTGKQLNQNCPDLPKRRHGTWMFDTRIDTSAILARRLKRGGYDTETAASDALDLVCDLIKLAGSDGATRRRIGDLIFDQSKRGGQLPTVEDMRRRIGARGSLERSETFGEAWAAWIAGKRKLRESARVRYKQIGTHWLLPVLTDMPLDHITGEHCEMVFERVEMFNEEIEAAAAQGRKPVLPGDVRRVRKYVGVATQHRIYAALRVFLNHAWKKAHKITFNPVYAVELEPETREAPLVWDAGQVVRFLEHTTDDPLHFLWRLALLRGFRRGELAGMADDDLDVDERVITVNVALLQIGGRLVWGRPKSKAGERVVDIDEDSVTAGKAHRARRKRERLAAGEAWQESGRMFTREDGTPLNPDYLTRRFKELAGATGLPVIKFHAARHTAATLMFDADIDIKIVQETLGHSTSVITRDIYTHVRRQRHRDAADKVVTLLQAPTGRVAQR
jgi:integrase